MQLARSLALAAVLLPAAAGAQPGDPTLGEYRRIATQGQDAFNRAAYDEARQLWRRAREVLPNPRIHRLLGRVAAQLGDHVDAVRMFRLALEGPENGNPLTDAQRDEIRDTLLPASLRQVAELVVEVRPEGATVTIDGEQVDLATGPLLVAPSVYALVVRAAGFETHERSVDLQPGERASVSVVLEATRAEPPPPPASRSLDLLGPIVLFGVAGAALVTFAITGSLALAENDRLADTCGSRSTRSCTDTDLSVLGLMTAITDAAWIGALAAGAAGAVWLVIELSAQQASDGVALQLSPYVGAGGAGLTLGGAWSR